MGCGQQNGPRKGYLQTHPKRRSVPIPRAVSLTSSSEYGVSLLLGARRGLPYFRPRLASGSGPPSPPRLSVLGSFVSGQSFLSGPKSPADCTYIGKSSPCWLTSNYLLLTNCTAQRRSVIFETSRHLVTVFKKGLSSISEHAWVKPPKGPEEGS